MALSRDTKGKGHETTPMEVGTHPCRVTRVYDLGVQESEFKGQKKRAAEIMVGFEVLDQFMKDDNGKDDLAKPRMVSRRLKLYKGATRGREFEWTRALDPAGKYNGDWAAMARDRVPCFGNFTANDKGGKTYVNLDSLSGIPATMLSMIPAGQTEVQIFDLDNPDRELWDRMPEFLTTLITNRVKDDAAPITYSKTEAAVQEEQKVTQLSPALLAAMQEAQARVVPEVSDDPMDDLEEDTPW